MGIFGCVQGSVAELLVSSSRSALLSRSPDRKCCAPYKLWSARKTSALAGDASTLRVMGGISIFPFLTCIIVLSSANGAEEPSRVMLAAAESLCTRIRMSRVCPNCQWEKRQNYQMRRNLLYRAMFHRWHQRALL